MATKINVKCNFASVFAKYNTVEELKELANSICAQVKTAYETRFAELASSDDEVTVEVSADVEPTQTKAETKKASISKKEAAPKSKKSEEPKAKTEVKSDDLIAITDLAAIKKLGLKFEKYNDKCWVLRGNTKPLRKVLKEQFKGVFNSHITGGEGWLIRTANVQECAKNLGLKVKTA